MHTTTHCQICGKKSKLITYYIDEDYAECIAVLNSCELCEKCYDDADSGMIIVEGWTMTAQGLKLVYDKDADTFFSSSSESDV